MALNGLFYAVKKLLTHSDHSSTVNICHVTYL